MQPELTPELAQQVVAFVRAGGFTWVSARAAGVSRAVFRAWMRLGKLGVEPYRAFRDDVLQAKAQARVASEAEARKKDPKFWLKHGPGREQAGQPGWANPSRPVLGDETSHSVRLFESPDWQALCRSLLALFDDRPELQQVFTAALARVAASFDSQPVKPTTDVAAVR